MIKDYKKRNLYIVYSTMTKTLKRHDDETMEAS